MNLQDRFNNMRNMQEYHPADLATIWAGLKLLSWAGYRRMVFKESPYVWMRARYDYDTGQVLRPYWQCAEIFGCHPSTYQGRHNQALRKLFHLMQVKGMIIKPQMIKATTRTHGKRWEILQD